MTLSSFGYNFKQGVKNIWRNRMFTLASVVTMTTCIFLFGIMFSIILNVNAAANYYEQDIGITVLFNEGIEQSQIDEIGEEIRSYPGITEVTFTSAEEAWENFQQTYFADDPDAAASFGTDNPLANSASYTVKTEKIEDQAVVQAYISGLEGVRSVNRSDDVVRALSSFNTVMTIASLIVITILLVVAVILISMTINVGISVRKSEISIMKLIGATDGFVRAPFIVEGMLIGLIGTIIPLIILFFTYNSLLGGIISKYLTSLSSIFMDVSQVYVYLVPTALVLGIGIGFLGSLITVRKHLKV